MSSTKPLHSNGFGIMDIQEKLFYYYYYYYSVDKYKFINVLQSIAGKG